MIQTFRLKIAPFGYAAAHTVLGWEYSSVYIPSAIVVSKPEHTSEVGNISIHKLPKRDPTAKRSWLIFTTNTIYCAAATVDFSQTNVVMKGLVRE